MQTREQQFIEWLRTRLPQADLTNDTFYDASTRRIFTCDTITEGVHFDRSYFSPQDIGWRAMAVNLSDIAATGGVPEWALISIGVPQDTSFETLQNLYEGIETCARLNNCNIIGGDTSQSPIITVSITLIGRLPERATPGRRVNAKPGDIVAVTNAHGLSRTGLEALRQHREGFDVAKRIHLKPEPRLALGQQMAEKLQRYAMMDTSDGLADAALQLAKASGVDIAIDPSKLVIHPEVRSMAEQCHVDPLEWVLYGGEDFELIVCMPEEKIDKFAKLTPIGQVRPAQTPRQGTAYLETQASRVQLSFDKTYQHFEGHHQHFHEAQHS